MESHYNDKRRCIQKTGTKSFEPKKSKEPKNLIVTKFFGESVTVVMVQWSALLLTTERSWVHFQLFVVVCHITQRHY